MYPSAPPARSISVVRDLQKDILTGLNSPQNVLSTILFQTTDTLNCTEPVISDDSLKMEKYNAWDESINRLK
jgi:hypothetical protein